VVHTSSTPLLLKKWAHSTTVVAFPD